MKLVLIGYMGSGKTTIGKLLAKKFGVPFRDLDQIIEETEGMPIREIFRTKGEIYFRKREGELLKDTLNSSDSFILATGGGTPCYGDAMIFMTSKPDIKTVYLRTPISELAARLFKEKEQRPLLAHLNTIEEMASFIGIHLFERTGFYSRSDWTVDSQADSPEVVAEKIAQLVIPELP